MKKILFVILLTAGALLLGLGLPSAVTALQADREEKVEAAGITEVDISVSSGLTHMEKLQILSDPACTVLSVGVGRHQTPASLAQHSWTLLDLILTGFDAQILERSTVQQVEQFALMASLDDQPFLYWEVRFTDAAGSVLRLHLDDETGLPLAIHYVHADPYSIDPEITYTWCLSSLYALREHCGITLSDPDYEGIDGSFYQLPVTDGEAEATVAVQLGEGWFSIGSQIS